MSTWHIDGAHSEIGFKVRHLMVSNVKGLFKAFEGTITSTDDSFLDAAVSFSIDMESIDTRNDQRDGHLKSPEFFDVTQFPKLTFVSKSFTSKGNNEFEVVGALTMKGVTKDVTLKPVLGGISKGMDGKRVAAFEVTGMLKRSEFGVTWNAPVETGGVVVSDEVMFDMNVEAKEE
jgi:polyisoprenoid-binding protein YceI